jgi:hypothetical protein
MDPPGRFLKEDRVGVGVWFDMGDASAIKKTGQALREDAPDIINMVDINNGDNNSDEAAATVQAAAVAVTTAIAMVKLAETAAFLLQEENSNDNSQGGIIHPTEHEKRRQVEQTLMDAYNRLTIASYQLTIASEAQSQYEESRARIAAMDGSGGSYLTYFMTSGMDVPRFTISSYLDYDSRINLSLTSKRMKDEFYAHNSSNNNSITNNNNDDNMKFVREIVISRTGDEGRVQDFFSNWCTNYESRFFVISRTGDEGRVRDFFSNWCTNYKNRNNNGLDERLPFFTRMVVDNRTEINGYDYTCEASRRQLIGEDSPMKFVQDLDLSSSPGSDNNVCAHFPCILSILVPNIRHLNLSNTRYNNNNGSCWYIHDIVLV